MGRTQEYCSDNVSRRRAFFARHLSDGQTEEFSHGTGSVKIKEIVTNKGSLYYIRFESRDGYLRKYMDPLSSTRRMLRRFPDILNEPFYAVFDLAGIKQIDEDAVKVLADWSLTPKLQGGHVEYFNVTDTIYEKLVDAAKKLKTEPVIHREGSPVTLDILLDKIKQEYLH